VPDGILAGVMVSVGGAVLLSVDNRYAGAALFSIALLSICYFGFNLYTGKVGFLWNTHDKDALSMAFLGLLGNLLGTLLVGFLIFMIYTFQSAKKQGLMPTEEELEDNRELPNDYSGLWRNICFIILGLACLIVGSDLFVDAASFVAYR